MLGSFSISMGDERIDDSANRSHKVWLLLAYLIYNRRRIVPQEELVDLLWGDESNSANPVGALKTTLHRARATLDQLGPAAGHDLIVRKSGGYSWNEEFATQLDVSTFDSLRQAASSAESPEEQLEQLLQALALYRGDFLNKLSSETWVVPISAYYHNLYIQTALDALPLLESSSRPQEAVDLCRAAIQIEPYREELYQHLMRNQLTLGDQKGAVSTYEEMSELLLSNFGILPSEESRAIYRETVKTVNTHAVPLGTIQEQLREESPAAGAMMCGYDFFKLLYQAEARSIARSGDAIHIGLLTMTGENNEDLSKRSLGRAMDNLQEQIRTNLRRGDAAARCSASQFILMLPHANYENSCMVCERIIKAFARQYPHSPAELHYSVQPMEPIV